MRHRRGTRGFTLIENMIALAVLLVGAAGTTAIFQIGLKTNGDARRMLRATAIAEDLLDNIALWPYQNDVAGTPLANTSPANDADIGDTQLGFERDATPMADGLADHDESSLTAMGGAWTGIPTTAMGEYQRFWNVRYVDTNGNGINDMVQIAVIVRWPHGGGWRRVVLVSAKLNPGGS